MHEEEITTQGSNPVRGAIVVGASSGIGAALVRQLAGDGWHVVALARREEKLRVLQSSCSGLGGRVDVRVHDVRHSGEVPGLMEACHGLMGRVDLVIYAAGVLLGVEADEYNTAKDLETIAINFSGCVAWGNAAAELFSSQRSGTLIGISSIAGDRGRVAKPIYGASKAGMDHYLEALRNRLAPFGVHVLTIRPGYIATEMTAGMEGMFWVIDADEAARLILHAMRSRAQVRYVPWRWKIVAGVIRSIPSILFRRLGV